MLFHCLAPVRCLGNGPSITVIPFVGSCQWNRRLILRRKPLLTAQCGLSAKTERARQDRCSCRARCAARCILTSVVIVIDVAPTSPAALLGILLLNQRDNYCRQSNAEQ